MISGESSATGMTINGGSVLDFGIRPKAKRLARGFAIVRLHSETLEAAGLSEQVAHGPIHHRFTSGCQHSGRSHSQGRSQQSLPTTIVPSSSSNPVIRPCAVKIFAGFEARQLL
jgi:hypothetical protein